MKRRAILCLVLVAIAACGPASPTPTTSTPPAGPSAGPSAVATESGAPPSTGATFVRIYLLAEERLVAVQREIQPTPAVARAAVEQVIAGPSQTERSASPGLSSSVPDGTVLLGLDIVDGLATVDLSKEFESGGGSSSMFSRLAQIVYTLTQFPTVDRVAFELAGKPVTVFSGEGILLDRPSVRADFDTFLPSIFVDRPAYGVTLDHPARIAGLANVFEATFLIEIRDALGNALVTRQVMATCGTGCWGTFDVTVPYSVGSPQRGSVVVYDRSAKDGSVENLRSYPVLLVP
jgi:hypothetical protein